MKGQHMKSRKFYALLLAIFFVIACSKDKQENPASEFSGIDGTLYYTFAGNVFQLDLQTGIQSLYFSYNTYSFGNWDLSMDGKYRLTSEREPGEYQKTKFKLLNANNGLIVKEFNYIPPEGSGTGYLGQLSPDNSKILIKPDLYNGIVIADMDGNILHHLEKINDSELELGDDVIWLPDNSILLTLDERYILKSEPPYNSLTLVKEMEYEDWGNIYTNKSGSKISMFIGNHIYVMDIDGNNLTQVTDSDSGENFAIFSPNGKYLLVGANYVHGPIPTGAIWNLKIIPNDGKIYNLNNDEKVVSVQPVNENIPAAVAGRSFWIP